MNHHMTSPMRTQQGTPARIEACLVVKGVLGRIDVTSAFTGVLWVA